MREDAILLQAFFLRGRVCHPSVRSPVRFPQPFSVLTQLVPLWGIVVTDWESHPSLPSHPLHPHGVSAHCRGWLDASDGPNLGLEGPG